MVGKDGSSWRARPLFAVSPILHELAVEGRTAEHLARWL